MELKQLPIKVAFLIPAYNEERTISSVLHKIEKNPTIGKINRKDIIIVDDGSKDKTVEMVEKEGVTLIKHSKNMGKGMAHKTGFNYAIEKGYDYVITLDGDGQHEPDELGRFIKAIKMGKEDIIIGTRFFTPQNMPLDRFLTNYVTSFVVSFLSHKNIRDSQSGYRAISVEVLKDIKIDTARFQAESEILIKAGKKGYRIGRVPISTIYGDEVSKISPFIDTIRFIQLVLRSLWV